MFQTRFIAFLLLLGGLAIGYFNFSSQTQADSRFPLKLGLDLAGGTHLVYKADISGLPADQVDQSMEALRDVIERRVNLFGVSEPLVQIETGSVLAGKSDENRLVVELPGVTDIDRAIAMIGATPVLEFKIQRSEEETQEILDAREQANETGEVTEKALQDPYFESTLLTGRFLKRSTLQFDSTTSEPVVTLEFNEEGADLFEEITTEHVGEIVAIYLDGAPISTPVVNEPITAGQAVISGSFTAQEAKQLVGRLNSGALPVPISLLSTQTIGAALGAEAFDASVRAGVYGLLAVALFLVAWYRLSGLIAVFSLGIYIAMMIALFKLVPVTMTVAGIAGFILSIGMAVDANILIFERVKEELKRGKAVRDAMREGFARAWLSIRDGNISSIITAIILFWFGTSIVEGFALTFGIGVLVSMFSAITVTRMFLYAMSWEGKKARWLFSAGIK